MYGFDLNSEECMGKTRGYLGGAHNTRNENGCDDEDDDRNMEV